MKVLSTFVQFELSDFPVIPSQQKQTFVGKIKQLIINKPNIHVGN